MKSQLHGSQFSLYNSALRQGEFYPQVIAYYYKQWQGFTMGFHTHQAVEIMYVISGQCQIEVETEVCALQKGHFIIIDALIPHRLIVDEASPCRMLNIEFLFKAQKLSFPSLKQLAQSEASLMELLKLNKPYIMLRDPQDVHNLLKSLVLELDSDHENELMVQLLLAQLLIRISRLLNESMQNPVRATDDYIRQVIDYMHHHYDRDIKVNDMAQAVNLHPGYLQRLFKNKMACSLIDYLNAHRMDKAKMLLTQTDIPVTEISEYVGVNTRQYFSALFKKHTGQSPLHYRQTIQAEKRNSPM